MRSKDEEQEWGARIEEKGLVLKGEEWVMYNANLSYCIKVCITWRWNYVLILLCFSTFNDNWMRTKYDWHLTFCHLFVLDTFLPRCIVTKSLEFLKIYGDAWLYTLVYLYGWNVLFLVLVGHFTANKRNISTSENQQSFTWAVENISTVKKQQVNYSYQGYELCGISKELYQRNHSFRLTGSVCFYNW